jgi:hypothetical protein
MLARRARCPGAHVVRLSRWSTPRLNDLDSPHSTTPAPYATPTALALSESGHLWTAPNKRATGYARIGPANAKARSLDKALPPASPGRQRGVDCTTTARASKHTGPTRARWGNARKAAHMPQAPKSGEGRSILIRDPQPWQRRPSTGSQSVARTPYAAWRRRQRDLDELAWLCGCRCWKCQRRDQQRAAIA